MVSNSPEASSLLAEAEVVWEDLKGVELEPVRLLLSRLKANPDRISRPE